ncbi:thioredoxin-disulfide reductase [Candidatus Woesebacteria bacterium RIFCSPHIGHO2_01_FULL_44_10]|uniref:Thioredoxin reductase n=1 Tax=Candidatus Woesebacteria bacterium RIFCSPLOWO2_01_FULL_44_14 TaxID=1802525 RepID=A0A1F8BZR2_9BACT|nr:MAG: thioredoxin-disulfide reductase [Candidatus Woesebacteria bacterium RIFCSPHIGHO2_01_FULL_44_10]OGM69502.1 MAG: thioredoxin-disulfide reductase [Candidatus Woesebacteria bacterium RIFCSPLOWO2_01_FULL_44_14]
MEQIVFAKKPAAGGVWDTAIIGSGPAALTAAIYTTRGAASTVILGGENWGGQLMLTTTVDNYPALPGIQGPDLMVKMRDHAVMFGAEFVQKNVESVDFSASPFVLRSSDFEFKARSAIIATGADTKWLGVAGEDKLRGKGVSSCAPCDAPFFKGKSVAVIGGGDSAMEEALVLTKYATNVTIIHRRDEFRASEAMQQKVKTNPQIKILWNTEVKEFVGEQKLEKIKLLNTKDNSETEIPIDGAFIAIGNVPSSFVFKENLDLDEKGYIKKLETEKWRMGTSVEGVFVSGDVHDYHYKQAITAAGFGCMAAMDALKYLDKSGPSW